jgi:hypothetical protein
LAQFIPAITPYLKDGDSVIVVEQEKGKYIIDPVSDQAITEIAKNDINIISNTIYFIHMDQELINLISIVENTIDDTTLNIAPPNTEDEQQKEEKK